MKKSLCLSVAAAVLAFPAALSRADDKPASATEKRNVWMKQKLQMSQNILAALTESDFDKVKTSATALNASGYLEKYIERGKPRSEEYQLQLANFEFYNRELIRQARDQNIDGASLAYNLMTTSCIQCHKIVRDTKK